VGWKSKKQLAGALALAIRGLDELQVHPAVLEAVHTDDAARA
jgi:hypothetical protein